MDVDTTIEATGGELQLIVRYRDSAAVDVIVN